LQGTCGTTHSCVARFVDFVLSLLRATVIAMRQRCVAVAVCGSQYREIEERIVSPCRSPLAFRPKLTSLYMHF